MTATNRTEIIPATPDLLRRFYGRTPVCTSLSVVAVRGDEILGVAGVYFQDGKTVVFAELTDEIRKDKRTIVRGIREVMRLARTRRLPVYSLADPTIEKSGNLLKHIGFVHEDGEVYRCPTL